MAKKRRTGKRAGRRSRGRAAVILLAAALALGAAGLGVWRLMRINAVPDFLAFSDGNARLDDSQTARERSYERIAYILTGEAADALLPEYMTLLDDAGLHLDGADIAPDGSKIYRFLCDEPEKKDSIPVGEGDDAARFQLLLTDRRNGWGGAEISVAVPRGTQIIDGGARTNYAPLTAAIQDFTAFCNGAVLSDGVDASVENCRVLSYSLVDDTAVGYAGEYIELLASHALPFYLTEASADDGSGREVSLFDHVGSGETATFSYGGSGEAGENVPLVTELITEGEGLARLRVWVADGILVTDVGLRAGRGEIPACVPDFYSFSRGCAAPETSGNRAYGDRYDLRYVYADEAGDALTPAYIDLLTSGGFFSLRGSAREEGAETTVNYYWFTCEGDARVSTFSMTAGGGAIEMIDVSLLLRDYRNNYGGGGGLVFTLAPELQIRDAGVYAGYSDESQPELQDFAAFTENRVQPLQEDEVSGAEGFKSVFYDISDERDHRAALDYIRLLQNMAFRFYEAGEDSFVNPEDAAQSENVWWFNTFTGPEVAASTLAVTSDGKTLMTVGPASLLVRLIYHNGAPAYLCVTYMAEDIPYVDLGLRETAAR